MRIRIIIALLLSLAAILISAGCVQNETGGSGSCSGPNETWCPADNRCYIPGEGSCPANQSIDSFEECVAAGYPVLESYPRQCRVPGGPTFTEDILPRLCQEEGGNWNECSSRCRLDNQGKPDVFCPTVCEPLCECGGVAGFRCPSGYHCQAPSGIPDALGYCVPEEAGNLTPDQAIALARNSSCVREGNLTGDLFYNTYSRTWWIGLEPAIPHPGCNPACVVSEDSRTAEINWRCTGAVPPLYDITNITCSAPEDGEMTLGAALQIAGTGPCAEVGSLTDRHVCNDYAGTWWIDLEPASPRQGCAPACVVNITTGDSEVNWRCTGLISP